MSNEYEQEMSLGDEARSHFDRIKRRLGQWGERNPVLVGMAEMAAGSALIYAGIQWGAVELDVNVVVSKGGAVGALATGGPVLFATYALGSIGIAALGGAVAVPAAVLGLSGTILAGLAGYAVGDMLENLIDPVTISDLLGPGALVALGVALILDGARRVTKNAAVAAAVSTIRNGVVFLGRITVDAVIASLDELQLWMADLASNPAAAGVTTAVIAGSIVLANSAAASSVTVLGSTALGSVGMSLGLVSAPIWPVLAAGGAAAALCYGVWRLASSHRERTGVSRAG